MTNQVIALGICGSIAAYKAADLTSKLTQQGITVQVIMTKSACELVQPQTFFTLSRQPVITSLWDSKQWQPEHISLAERASLLVIAPATANIIAKIAHGIGDDALSTYALSHTGKIIIVPAMNPRMWHNPVVQDNCRLLRERNITILEPGIGHVACGEEGQGRFPDVTAIVDFILSMLAFSSFSEENFKNKKVLITAGPTREYLDPVRFLTNRSSGKMGFSLATAACSAGCQTTLICGPNNLTTPLNCQRIDVTTASEMKDAVLEQLAQFDILIMCAAVADYRPKNIQDQKIKKAEDFSLSLVRTEDILLSIKDLKQPHQRFIGFAAETQFIEESALHKLTRKNLDMIIANDVSRSDIGFNSEENEVTFYYPNQAPEKVSKCPKRIISAYALFKIITSLK